ncbi:MAG: hypothetical protein ACRCTY_10200 [Candidatus Adiutrix sp.]
MPVLLIVGLSVLALGVVLFFVWLGHIMALIKAFAPMMLIGLGLIISYIGWQEMRDRKEATIDFSTPNEATRYKAEARAYQAERNVITQESPKSLSPESDSKGGPIDNNQQNLK